MEIQARIVKFVVSANWALFGLSSAAGFLFAPFKFALGIFLGGLLVTANFHMLHRTLKKSFRPPHIASVSTVMAKYYVRFVVSGIILFILISRHIVNPLGLFVGLSVVVASIMIATILEFRKLLIKEAL
jgi:hypothetical protein